jgi:hypothetical protein
MAGSSSRISSTLSARPVAAGLAAACAVLVLLNVYLLAGAVDTSPILPGAQTAGAGEQTDASLATPLDTKPISEFRETVRRPLFNSTRKPVDRPRTTSQVATQTGSALDMRLVGIVRSGSAPGRALIRLAEESNGKWIAEGDTYNGWKLRSVKDRSIIVEAEGRSHELTLQVVVRRSDEQDGTPEPATKSR